MSFPNNPALTDEPKAVLPTHDIFRLSRLATPQPWRRKRVLKLRLIRRRFLISRWSNLDMISSRLV